MAADFIATALRVRQRYLNLLEAALTGVLHQDPSIAPWALGPYSTNVRMVGGDWPATAQTMIGRARLRNLRQACETVILEEVPGDFLEAGVWRGGACILMRGILEAYGDNTRRVFVADSFKDLPPPSPELYPSDTHDVHHTKKELAVSRQQVEDNFQRYDLLDDRVIFLEGWFKDTLPTAPVDRLAVLRLDSDMYESTIQTFENCYHKLSRGGIVIVDDYNAIAGTKLATNDFRDRHGITSPILPIDFFGAWWTVDHPPILGGRTAA